MTQCDFSTARCDSHPLKLLGGWLSICCWPQPNPCFDRAQPEVVSFQVFLSTFISINEDGRMRPVMQRDKLQTIQWKSRVLAFEGLYDKLHGQIGHVTRNPKHKARRSTLIPYWLRSIPRTAYCDAGLLHHRSKLRHSPSNYPKG